MDIETIIKRAEIERTYEYRKWLDKIPTLNFEKEWNVQISPPFGGAMVRFRVKNNGKDISVYLDCHDELGFMGQPYWEAYPIDGDTQRFYLNETKELIACIKKELKKI